MKRAVLALVVGALAVPTVAAAEDVQVSQQPAAQNAVSLQLLSLSARALAVEYERFVLPPKLSVVGALALRDNAGGEFQSQSLALGAEARYWFTGRPVWSRLGRGNMAGWYVSGRLDMSRTGTRDEVLDESLGSTLTVAESINGGYRFVAWGKMEITPSLGLQVRTDIDMSGRLSPWTRGAVVLGLTMGWMF